MKLDLKVRPKLDLKVKSNSIRPNELDQRRTLPLFFIAFLNDLPEKCVCVPLLFADDLRLASSSLIDFQKDLLSLTLT